MNYEGADLKTWRAKILNYPSHKKNSLIWLYKWVFIELTRDGA